MEWYCFTDNNRDDDDDDGQNKYLIASRVRRSDKSGGDKPRCEPNHCIGHFHATYFPFRQTIVNSLFFCLLEIPFRRIQLETSSTLSQNKINSHVLNRFKLKNGHASSASNLKFKCGQLSPIEKQRRPTAVDRMYAITIARWFNHSISIYIFYMRIKLI